MDYKVQLINPLNLGELYAAFLGQLWPEVPAYGVLTRFGWLGGVEACEGMYSKQNYGKSQHSSKNNWQQKNRTEYSKRKFFAKKYFI
jgi:hypothetical protein